MNTRHAQSAAIVGIERQGANVLLAIRDGDRQLTVTLAPKRASLIIARLAYATAEAMDEQEKDEAALATPPVRLLRRTNVDGQEFGNA